MAGFERRAAGRSVRRPLHETKRELERRRAGWLEQGGEPRRAEIERRSAEIERRAAQPAADCAALERAASHQA